MRKNKRKLTACALAVILGLSCMGYPVQAEEMQTEDSQQTEDSGLLELDETTIETPENTESNIEAQDNQSSTEDSEPVSQEPTETKDNIDIPANEPKQTEEISNTNVPAVQPEPEGENDRTPYANNTGDFTVTGGTYGVDYTYSDNKLEILTSTPLTISTNGKATSNLIRGVTYGGIYNLTFNNLAIDVSNTKDTIILIHGELNLTLSGNNSVKGSMGIGLSVGDLTVTSASTGTLDLRESSLGIECASQYINYGKNYEGNMAVNGGSVLYNDADIKGTISTSGTGTINGEKYEFTTSTYLDANGREQTADNVTVVDGNSTTWDSGWYVVNRNVTMDSRVTVNGDVHLILADGYSLNAENGGINVGENQSLTIYGQIGRTGKLTAKGGENQAGIGSDFNSSGGSITINGGNVTATGGLSGAGIGSGSAAPVAGGSGHGSGGNITINGGNVTATGVYGGAGIGGGNCCSGGNITINGGNITATGDVGGAGIGGGPNGIGGSIAINGGNVTAKGSERGAGIGGGMNSRGGDITITGGSVNAAGGINSGSGKSYTGIGDEGYASGSGSSTFSTGEKGNAFIITNSISDQSNKNSWSGVIFEGNNGQVYGNPTIQNNAEVPADAILTVPEDTTLTIPDSVTLTNKGTILNHGTINGKISGNQPKNFAPTPTVTIEKAKTTASSITVKELEEKEKYGGAQYSLNKQIWQDSNVFTDLHSAGYGGSYTVYARYKGNGSYLQSEAGKIENVSTNVANYTITIPAEPVSAGNENSKAEIKPSDSFDVGYGGQATVKIKENSSVSGDGKLMLTRQDDPENHTITSALLVNGKVLGNINTSVATFTMSNKMPVSVSFDSPTSENATIPAGTYNGTITFEVSYSESTT